MSQYINFYVKGKSGKRIPIGSYSRNSTLFKQCREFVPFEATAPLNNIRFCSIKIHNSNKYK